MSISPGTTLRELRERKPLVHQITNYVVMNETANATLALGALPVMAHAPEEVEEMVGLASALVLNIGTLSEHWIEAMLLAGRAASERGIPVVLDPVGAGATAYRTDTARRILDEVDVTVLRGNAGEVATLVGADAEVRGVESIAAGLEPAELAREAGRQLGLVASVTGPVDHVSDGERVLAVANGHPLLAAVTGTGCISSALTGCFLAAKPEEPLEAAAEALAALGVAAEDAADGAEGRAPSTRGSTTRSRRSIPGRSTGAPGSPRRDHARGGRRVRAPCGARAAGARAGIEHDAAVVDGLVVTQDVLVEGVHFRFDLLGWRELGARAAAVNVSDLAASGADPLALLVSLGLPPETELDDVLELYAGLNERGVPVRGGDTTRADRVVPLRDRARPLGARARPRGARPGDLVVVTGPLGAAGAAFRNGSLPPVPNRVEEGKRLARWRPPCSTSRTGSRTTPATSRSARASAS